MYTVYILLSEEFDKTYVGFTSDLEERLKSHNKLGTKGWTLKFCPWKLIHTEVYSSKTEAMKREKFLKSGIGRDFIRSMMKDSYPPKA